VKFEAEMVEKGVLKREEQKARTGRMFFMEAKDSGKEPGAAEPGPDSKSRPEGAVVYDAALFGEEDLDDLDDLDDLSGDDA